MTPLPSVRHSYVMVRDMLATAGPFIVLTIALLVLAYVLLDPTPPKRLVLATGPAQGAYAEFGTRYQAWLKKYGVEVELRSTEGSAENLALLRDPKSGVQFAFVQGGSDRLQPPAGEPEEEGLVSLGSLFYEPVWIFYREDSARARLKKAQLDSVSQLKGWKINVGADGSGVTNLMMRLLDANGLEASDVDAKRMQTTPAVMAFLDGQIDAVTFASAPESLMVQMLLQTPGVRLLDFAQAEAYSRRLPVVSPVMLPRGVVDLARDIPPQDVRLVAPTARLVARDDTHPALQQLLVQAAREIHGGSGWFQRRGDFPSARSVEQPLSKEAQRFYQSGPPFLQRYLPFWMANLVDRMWVVLVSIIAVLIPLSRVVPPLYELRIRSRVFRWYASLKRIEDGLTNSRASPRALMEELDGLDARLKQINVPLAYTDELYALRGYIDLVRGKLRDAAAQAEAAQQKPQRTGAPAT
ncbi:MAG TPA: TAXI family TRAP transporter solute-binding subunit [Burkholderiaceae bacterium]|jgi:TRAP transporter TAXI family solute receptor|nr:TAXI family TRAP transporter solute-binding subunit [Burkholderiaceae bacterium]